MLTFTFTSGKSSVILTLLNFLEMSGQILVDDIDITKLPRDQLRRAITTISQEPVEIRGSVVNNILPFDLLSPDGEGTRDNVAIDKVLDDLGLLDHINRRGGIEAPYEDMKFSAGQKQLINIARAILHQHEYGTKLILMDEVTSNMDYDSDRRAQDAMNMAFAGCTRIMISHRLSGFNNCDVILTLSNGSLIKTQHMERDAPVASLGLLTGVEEQSEKSAGSLQNNSSDETKAGDRGT